MSASTSPSKPLHTLAVPSTMSTWKSRARFSRPDRRLILICVILILTPYLTINVADRALSATMRMRPLPSMARLFGASAHAPCVHQPETLAPRVPLVSQQLTIAIKTYVCDASNLRLVAGLVRSIRNLYPTVTVLVANDGPVALARQSFVADDAHTRMVHVPSNSGISFGRNALVNATTTPFFLLLDDDHLFDVDIDLSKLVDAADKFAFDLVGMRVRNLPGIEELEEDGILIPRYVANITSFENRQLTLCVWNENVGPDVRHMVKPLRVDVLHNAFLARTDVLRRHRWRNELMVNEHMSFFIDARAAALKVGYLPSVFVHHRPRRKSTCYERVRFREEKFERLLDYKDDFKWTPNCYKGFVEYAAQHVQSQLSPDGSQSGSVSESDDPVESES